MTYVLRVNVKNMDPFMKFLKLLSLSFFLMVASGFSEGKSSEIEEKMANEVKQQEVLIEKFKE